MFRIFLNSILLLLEFLNIIIKTLSKKFKFLKSLFNYFNRNNISNLF